MTRLSDLRQESREERGSLPARLSWDCSLPERLKTAPRATRPLRYLEHFQAPRAEAPLLCLLPLGSDLLWDVLRPGLI